MRTPSVGAQCDAFPGLFPLVYAYLDTLDMEEGERVKLERYLDLIKRRTDGMYPQRCLYSMQR